MKTGRWKSINISSVHYQNYTLCVPALHLLRIKVPPSGEGTEVIRSRYGESKVQIEFIILKDCTLR